MGTSKILIDGVGIDLNGDTVAANKMLSGIKAHDSNGESVTGSIATWTGQQASGVKNITANGTYDVTEYASAAVNVAGEVIENATILGYPKHELTPTWKGVNDPNANREFLMDEIVYVGWKGETRTVIPTKSIGNSGGGTPIVQFPNLKRVELRCKVDVNYELNRIFSRANCPQCSEIILGGIGFPVYRLLTTTGVYTTTLADNLTLTLYVNANSIADIPSNIKNSQPWGFTTATIIYRNSTTGEVLT